MHLKPPITWYYYLILRYVLSVQMTLYGDWLLPTFKRQLKLWIPSCPLFLHVKYYNDSNKTEALVVTQPGNTGKARRSQFLTGKAAVGASFMCPSNEGHMKDADPELEHSLCLPCYLSDQSWCWFWLCMFILVSYFEKPHVGPTLLVPPWQERLKTLLVGAWQDGCQRFWTWMAPPSIK